MKIVGVGLDEPETNQAWAEEEAFEFELWTDDDKALGLTYGALSGDTDTSVKRITRVLDADGLLVLEYDEVDVGTSPFDVLDDCGILFGG